MNINTGRLAYYGRMMEKKMRRLHLVPDGYMQQTYSSLLVLLYHDYPVVG